MSNTTYLSCAETAKLLRQALKESFPDVKFSVRSSTYSGGASIRVCWTDGPTTQAVESVSETFSGAYFDGMIDYKGCRYHMLDGEAIRFGADFIFTERKLSKNRAEKIAELMPRFVDEPPPTVTGSDEWGWRVSYGGRDPRLYLIDDAEAKLADAVDPLPSATLARTEFAGDDRSGRLPRVAATVSPEVAAAFDPGGILQAAGLMAVQS